MNLQQDWPLAAAAALGVVAVVAYSKGGTAGYTIGNTDTTGATAVATAEIQGQNAQQAALSGVLSDVLGFEANTQQINASEYETELQAQSANYQTLVSGATTQFSALQQAAGEEAQAAAQVAATKAAQPPWWQVILADVAKVFSPPGSGTTVNYGAPPSYNTASTSSPNAALSAWFNSLFASAPSFGGTTVPGGVPAAPASPYQVV